jgi:hypothetical protein
MAFRWHRSFLFTVIGLFMILQSGQAFGQIIFGEPTSTVGGTNRFSLSIGGGGVILLQFKFDDSPLTYVTPTQTFVFEGEETPIKFEGEYVFLTGAYRLGAAGEIFLTIGQMRLKDKDEIFDGELGLFLGGGVRISPPQPGPFKAGLVLQGFSGKTRDESLNVVINAFQNNPGNTSDSIFSEGTGEDEIEYMGLSAMIGVSAHHFTSFHPYAGLMLTYLKGNQKGSVSGNGNVNHCVIGAGCTVTSEPFTASWDMDFEVNTMIGGIIGFQFSPEGPFTVTVEGQLGTQFAYFVSAGMQF